MRNNEEIKRSIGNAANGIKRIIGDIVFALDQERDPNIQSSLNVAFDKSQDILRWADDIQYETSANYDLNEIDGCFGKITYGASSPRDLDLLDAFANLMQNMRADELEAELLKIKKERGI